MYIILIINNPELHASYIYIYQDRGGLIYGSKLVWIGEETFEISNKKRERKEKKEIKGNFCWVRDGWH